MCIQGKYRLVEPERLPGIKYADMSKLVPIDECMADLILFLNDNGLRTYGCCCGHGEKDSWIQFRSNIYLAYKLMKQTEYKMWRIQVIENGVKTIRIPSDRNKERWHGTGMIPFTEVMKELKSGKEEAESDG